MIVPNNQHFLGMGEEGHLTATATNSIEKKKNDKYALIVTYLI